MTRFMQLALLAALVSGSAGAAEDPLAVVPVGSGDFVSQKGVAKFQHRVRNAIEQVCGSYATIEADQLDEMNGCWSNARAQVKTQLANMSVPESQHHVDGPSGIASKALASASTISDQENVLSRFSQWEQRLRHRVNAQLVYPFEVEGPEGDVLVGFRIGPEGKPIDVSVRQSSGNLVLDKAAKRLVSSLGLLGPVPDAGRHVDEIVLKLSYGDPSSSDRESARLAKRDREERLANERRDRALISAPMQTAQDH